VGLCKTLKDSTKQTSSNARARNPYIDDQAREDNTEVDDLLDEEEERELFGVYAVCSRMVHD
jgi:hypothetical protein